MHMQYCDMALSWLCITVIVVLCHFTDFWVAASAAPVFAIYSPCEIMELSLFKRCDLLFVATQWA
jgi:hypothetical protein